MSADKDTTQQLIDARVREMLSEMASLAPAHKKATAAAIRELLEARAMLEGGGPGSAVLQAILEYVRQQERSPRLVEEPEQEEMN